MPLTNKQRDNCTKLAVYLESLPLNYEKFTMGSFFSTPDEDEDKNLTSKYLKGPVRDPYPCGTLCQRNVRRMDLVVLRGLGTR